MAKLGAVIDGWMTETNVAISAVQCWTSLEEYFGVVPCTVMSMMSNELMSSACEVDICGVIAMHALRWRRGRRARCWIGTTITVTIPTSASASIAATCRSISSGGSDGLPGDNRRHGRQGKHFGTCVGRVKASPMTYARFSTDDATGKIRGYLGEGEFTERSSRDLRRRRCRANPATAESAALHLRARL